MIYAWVLTVVFMTSAYSDNSTSQQYNFKTREECVKAQSFYSKLKFKPIGYQGIKAEVIASSCYPSYVTK